MVDIHGCDGQTARGVQMIDLRLDAEGIAAPFQIEVLCDELILSSVFIDDGRLPCEILVYQRTAEFVKFRSQASIDRGAHVGEILPGADPVAPVIQSERAVHGVQIVMERLAQMFDESVLHIGAYVVVVFGLVVQLESDHTEAVCRDFHEFADDALRVEAEDRMRDVHDLSFSVELSSGYGVDQHVRMAFRHPGRDRVGRCSDDHLKSVCFRRVQNAQDMREIKDTGHRFIGTPGGLRNADSIDPRILHHLHIFLKTFTGHIFVVIGTSKKQLTHV